MCHACPRAIFSSSQHFLKNLPLYQQLFPRSRLKTDSTLSTGLLWGLCFLCRMSCACLVCIIVQKLDSSPRGVEVVCVSGTDDEPLDPRIPQNFDLLFMRTYLIITYSLYFGPRAARPCMSRLHCAKTPQLSHPESRYFVLACMPMNLSFLESSQKLTSCQSLSGPVDRDKRCNRRLCTHLILRSPSASESDDPKATVI